MADDTIYLEPWCEVCKGTCHFGHWSDTGWTCSVRIGCDEVGPKYLLATPVRETAPKLLEALEKIALGEGIYGMQAGEYKKIAREAIAKVRGNS